MSHAIEIDAAAWTSCHVCHTALPSDAAFCGECGERQGQAGASGEIALDEWDFEILEEDDAPSGRAASSQPPGAAPDAGRTTGRVTAQYTAIDPEPEPEPEIEVYVDEEPPSSTEVHLEAAPESALELDVDVEEEPPSPVAPDPFPEVQRMLSELIAESDPRATADSGAEPIVAAVEYRHLDEDEYGGVLEASAEHPLPMPPKRTRPAATYLIVPGREPAEDDVSDSLRTGEFATVPIDPDALLCADDDRFRDDVHRQLTARQPSTSPAPTPVSALPDPPPATECTVFARAPLPPAPYWHAPPKGDTAVGPAPTRQGPSQ